MTPKGHVQLCTLSEYSKCEGTKQFLKEQLFEYCIMGIMIVPTWSQHKNTVEP